MNSILMSLLGGVVGSVAVTYLKGLIPTVQGPVLADIDKVLLNLNPNEKASLNGVIQILQQEFPQASQGGVNLLVGALVAKYPVLAPLQPTLVAFLDSVEAEVEKDVAPQVAPAVAPKA